VKHYTVGTGELSADVEIDAEKYSVQAAPSGNIVHFFRNAAARGPENKDEYVGSFQAWDSIRLAETTYVQEDTAGGLDINDLLDGLAALASLDEIKDEQKIRVSITLAD
jgi:hypothetical protein